LRTQNWNLLWPNLIFSFLLWIFFGCWFCLIVFGIGLIAWALSPVRINYVCFLLHNASSLIQMWSIYKLLLLLTSFSRIKRSVVLAQGLQVGPLCFSASYWMTSIHPDNSLPSQAPITTGQGFRDKLVQLHSNT
jgi:hypothetical protein